VADKSAAGVDPAKLLAEQRWSKTLSVDLQGAISSITTSNVAVAVSSIKPLKAADGSAQVYVEVRVSLDCGTTTALSTAAGSGSALISADISSSRMESSAAGDSGFSWSYLDYFPVQGPSDSQFQLITHVRLASRYSNMDYAENDFADAITGSTRRLLQTASAAGTKTLEETYNALVQPLSDSASPVFQGQLTSLADPTFPVVARDTSGQKSLAQPAQPQDCFNADCSQPKPPPADDNSNGGSGGKSFIDTIKGSPLYLGLCIAAAAVIVILIGVGVFFLGRYVHRRNSSKETLNRMTQPSIALTNNPTAAHFDSGRWNQI